MMRWPVVRVNNQASTDAVNAEESADGGHCCKSVAEIFLQNLYGQLGGGWCGESRFGRNFAWNSLLAHPGGLGKQCAWGLIVNELTENKVQNGKASAEVFDNARCH
jgi:hypothetical protein